MTQQTVWMVSEQRELHWETLSLHASHSLARQSLPSEAYLVARTPATYCIPSMVDAGMDRTVRIEEWPVQS